MTLHYETDGPLAIITLDRPDVANAIDRATAELLVRAFDDFEADPELRVAVLTGGGGKFCAGADLKAISRRDGNRVAMGGDGPLGVTRRMLSKPVIAAVEGHAVAGGLELALWCDLRVAATDAVFGVYCRRWGIPLMDGGTIRLARLVGQSHALDMVLTGRGVRGDEAARMGLANRLCEPGTALAAARRLALAIARLPHECLQSDRQSLYEQWDLSLPDAIRRETELGLDVIRNTQLTGLGRWTRGEWDVSEFA